MAPIEDNDVTDADVTDTDVDEDVKDVGASLAHFVSMASLIGDDSR